MCLAAAAALVLMTGCAATGTIAKPSVEADHEAVTVTGSCEAALKGGGSVLNVSGTCSLMDGTNGVISVLGADGFKIDEHRFTQEGGEISWDFAVGSDWPSIVYGFISFGTQNMDAQPGEVTKVYGRRFQNLEGPDVIWDTQGVVAVFQSGEVDIRSGKDEA